MTMVTNPRPGGQDMPGGESGVRGRVHPQEEGHRHREGKRAPGEREGWDIGSCPGPVRLGPWWAWGEAVVALGRAGMRPAVLPMRQG